MYDAMARCMLYGVAGGNGPWVKQEKVKFLCPVPGYDRHFRICESLGIEMINVPLLADGPDMDLVEELIKDESVKGMWCVPKYSNPSGTTYSATVVKRLASMKPAAKDFRIFWDNAYVVHDIYEDGDTLVDILPECEKYGNEDLPLIFTSTSKISFPGAGVAALAASPANLAELEHRMSFQTIGPDKLNQLRHARAFKNMDELKEHMRRHGEILKPKFDTVLRVLDKRVEGLEIASYTRPTGGYFIYLTMLEGTAKRTVELCKEAGLVLTPAGATHPHGIDPLDNSIRIAPSYPLIPELKSAAELLAVAVKYAALEKMLSK
jgi:DNA-binding transcriptional MocR family regulator